MNSGELDKELKLFVHNLLYTSVFIRLGASMADVEAEQTARARARLLAISSLEVLHEDEGFRLAAESWLKGAAGFRPMRVEMEHWLDLASGLDDVMPTPEFPSRETVLRSVDLCSAKLEGIARLPQLLSANRTEWLEAFWKEALVVSDAVRAMRLSASGPKQFWRMFRSRISP